MSRDITRRTFCAATGLGLVTLPAACEKVSEPHLGHPRDGSSTGAHPDLAVAPVPNEDAATGAEDLATFEGDDAGGGGNCATGGSIVNAGPASAIVAGTPKGVVALPAVFYVCRDAGGLYAVSGACTHQGCPVLLLGNKYVCPCHAATFDLDGENPTSPAPSPLPHLAVCVDGNGDVLVDTKHFVPAGVRA